tara:strand:- start:31407 stop:32084 length:678 start_codon:yes stop_codon:yes gene_type:complete
MSFIPGALTDEELRATPVPVENVNLDKTISEHNRVRGEVVTCQEQDMLDGIYFTSSLASAGAPVNNVTYTVINTGPKYYILEEMAIAINYELVTDGSVNVVTEFFAEDSDKSSFTVTGGTPANLGVPLNLDCINCVSEAEFVFGAAVSITGVPDFVVYASQYYKDTAGNRESLSGIQSSFFEKGRKLIMSPNKTYVFRTTSSGSAAGTGSSLTLFSFTEKADINS